MSRTKVSFSRTKSGFATSLAESFRLSVSNVLLRGGCASSCLETLTQVPTRLGLALTGLILIVTVPACSQIGTNRAASDSGSTPAASTSPVPRTAFERDLQFIRNGQFAHIWVFSRQDGLPIDKDDAAYLRANAPQVVDWVTTDDGKRVIAGSNFDLEQGNLPQLRQRFVVEDYTGR